MKERLLAAIFATTVFLLLLCSAGLAEADDLIVEMSPPANSGHYSTIQAAIDFADAVIKGSPAGSRSFQIKVQPGTYSGAFTPISNVPIIGSSTSDTIINSSGTAVTLNGVSNVVIRNFTFRNASLAISVSNSSLISVTNSIFNLNLTATAIDVFNSPSTSIINNTFYGNNIGIRTGSDITIINDLFASNNIAILPQGSLTLFSHNAFYNNMEKGVLITDPFTLPNIEHPGLDPRFVDPAGKDFHLQADSPCKGTGDAAYRNSFDSTSDIGAFGGPNSDPPTTTPATVTGLVSSISSSDTPPAVMGLSWDQGSNTAVTAYRVYYRTSPATTIEAAEGASGFTVSGRGTTSAPLTFNRLPPALTAPTTAPTLAAPVPQDRALLLSWTAVSGATGYRIYFNTASFDASHLPGTFQDVAGGTTTSALLTGLSNDTTYFVRVSALAGTQVLAAVTAVIDSNVASAPGTPNESPLSTETSQPIGTTVSGPPSNVQSDFPETVTAFPNLKGGCFIATAAYGFYSAPQVQALREFRDRYLLTNAPGRAFVAWYYRHGPSGARYLNRHQWLKAPVRLALLPMVGTSFFLVHTPPLAKIAASIVLLASWRYARVRLKRRREGNMLVQTGGER